MDPRRRTGRRRPRVPCRPSADAGGRRRLDPGGLVAGQSTAARHSVHIGERELSLAGRRNQRRENTAQGPIRLGQARRKDKLLGGRLQQ